MTQWIKTNRTVVLLGVAVLLAAYVFYFAYDPAGSMFESAWRYAVPLVLAALVGVIGERSGIVNIGIEGQMLLSAFAGFFTAAATGSLVIGVLAGVGMGLLLGAFIALTTVRWEMDQIIAGVVLNIVATGITSFYYVQGQTLSHGMPTFSVPGLSSIPLIGPMFFSAGPIALATVVIAVLVHYLLFRTRWGLRTRASGEYPSAADTAGVAVNTLRALNVTLAGGLAGLAGAYLSMEATSSFERAMTANRGFLALAIMIFGAWRPLRAMGAALFFGFMSATASELQGVGIPIPQQFTNLLPFVLTIVVLAIAAGKVRAPAAEGRPFRKGED